MLVCVDTDKRQELGLYLQDITERQKGLRIPAFKFSTYAHVYKNRVLGIMDVKVNVPPVYLIGLFLLVPALIFNKVALIVAGLCILSTSIFFTAEFFAFTFLMGLKKNYGVKARRVSCDWALRQVLENGPKRHI